MGALVTAFHGDGSVDYETFEKQVNFLIDAGLPFIAHPMHIGESPNLTVQERKDLATCLVKAAGGRVPTFVNVSMHGTDNMLDMASHVETTGATGNPQIS